MDLAKSWGAGLVVAVLAYFALGFVLSVVVTYDILASPLGNLLFLRAPAFVIPGLVAFVAGIVHPRPQREIPSRYVLAVIVVPALVLVVTAIIGMGERNSGTMAGALLVGLAGIAAGGSLAYLLRGRRRR